MNTVLMEIKDFKKRTLMDESYLMLVDFLLSKCGHWITQIWSRDKIATVCTTESEFDRLWKCIHIIST